MTDIARIKLLDEVNAVVIGLRPSEYDVISDSFALDADKFWFSPKFKAKQWDGKVRYFKRNGKTFVKLIPEIIPILKSIGYKVEIIDRRDNLQIKVPQIDENYLSEFGITLGDHQVELINTLTKNNGGMIKAGTGAGKTMCCWVLHDLYYKHCGFETLIIVPTADLILQTVQEFFMFSEDVGIWGDKKKDIDHPVVVSTWQTLQKQPSFVGKFKHIILDECHGGKEFTGQINKILNEYGKNCYVKSGMTGTFPPHESHMRTLECAMGKVLYEVTAKELIDAGWLAKLNLTLLRLKEDFKDDYKKFKAEDSEHEKITYTQYKKALFPEYPHEREYYAKSTERNRIISEFTQELIKNSEGGGNAVILVNTVKHGRALEKAIPNSKFIYGKDTTKVRKEMFKLFSERDDVILITTFGLAAIGLNIKRIFIILMIDAGTSFIRVIQTLGRGLRKAPDKDKVRIYDVSGDLYYSARHLTERKKAYASEGHKCKQIEVDYKIK